MRAFTLRHYVCGSDKSSWEIETSLVELKNGMDEVIYDAAKKLLVMFDFFVPNKEVVFDILNGEYQNLITNMKRLDYTKENLRLLASIISDATSGSLFTKLLVDGGWTPDFDLQPTLPNCRQK